MLTVGIIWNLLKKDVFHSGLLITLFTLASNAGSYRSVNDLLVWGELEEGEHPLLFDEGHYKSRAQKRMHIKAILMFHIT